jgi:hypothetical protein
MRTEILINYPRFRRNPIDTSVVVRMRKCITEIYIPALSPCIQPIREIVKSETGCDPLYEPKVRNKEYVKSRQLLVHFLRKNTNLSQKNIGALVDKNHTSVNYAEKCVEKFLLVEKEYANLYDRIDQKIIKSLNP